MLLYLTFENLLLILTTCVLCSKDSAFPQRPVKMSGSTEVSSSAQCLMVVEDTRKY